MFKDRGIQPSSPEPNRRGQESQPIKIDVIDLTNDEIISVRYEVLAYIEAMQQAFDKSSNLFADLEEQYSRYVSKYPAHESRPPMPEYSYISEIKYMESELILCFMTIGASVSEIGTTIIGILRARDHDVALVEPYRLGETFFDRTFCYGQKLG